MKITCLKKNMMNDVLNYNRKNIIIGYPNYIFINK